MALESKEEYSGRLSPLIRFNQREEAQMPQRQGRGSGRQGRGTGGDQGGRGKGMGPGGGGGGRGGQCVCPSCGKTVAHERGVPCQQVKCPDCGKPMTRQN